MQAKIAKLAAGGPGAHVGSSAQAWEVENMRERLYCQVLTICNPYLTHAMTSVPVTPRHVIPRSQHSELSHCKHGDRDGLLQIVPDFQQPQGAKEVVCPAQVCNSRRQKDRVIKCGHAFCSHCIEAMGKSRQRLCPGCQSKFDHRADVRPLYL